MKFTAGEHQSVVTNRRGGVTCENCRQEARDFDELRKIDCSRSPKTAKLTQNATWDQLFDVSL
ncbi:MAG: hypothetical protein ACM3NH_00345 [Candidatus Saccharibacteria bacterium]